MLGECVLSLRPEIDDPYFERRKQIIERKKRTDTGKVIILLVMGVIDFIDTSQTKKLFIKSKLTWLK